MNHPQKPLEIGMLLYPDLTLLDVIGPRTVLSWFANIARSGRWPSHPGEFHPEVLTDPDVNLSIHPARATH